MEMSHFTAQLRNIQWDQVRSGLGVPCGLSQSNIKYEISHFFSAWVVFVGISLGSEQILLSHLGVTLF